MRTLTKPQFWNILRLFYVNKNSPLHLRQISRDIKIQESATFRQLNELEKKEILSAVKEANLKKFHINPKYIPEIFPSFDEEKLEKLSLLRKKAIKTYLNNLTDKPIIMIVFGSTAKGTYKNDSDIDILEIFQVKTDTKKARMEAESMTGIRIQTFQMTYKDFIKELKIKEDKVIQSAIESGFPVFNSRHYYEVRQ